MLFPPILRDLVLGLADRGLYTPLWSAGVAAEWLHVTARKGETGAAQALARMQARWPGAEGPPGDPALLDLPDAADRHVLAAAIAAGADILLTQNLRDFPRRALAHHAMRALSPDDFTMDLWLAGNAPVEAEVARVWPGLKGAALRKALKKAGLPRLGRALER
ncbi:MAG: PIN domain-containing protein [Maritimibacter sp.]|nr:PIN domain-containing protein [Maritimibacter sp.]